MSADPSHSSPDVSAEEVAADAPLRRKFTPKERAAQQAAQAEEESLMRTEAAALLDEQKRVAAAIRARKVAFRSAGPEQSDAAQLHRDSDESSPVAEYALPSSLLTSVAFISIDGVRAAACYARARVAHARLLAPVMAAPGAPDSRAPSLSLPEATRPLMDAQGLGSVEEERTPTLRALRSLLSPSARQLPRFVVALDQASADEARGLLDALPAERRPVLLKHTLPDEGDITQAVQELVDTLPDLFSFHA